MPNIATRLNMDQEGAITTDWVALTAAVVMISVSAMYAFMTSAQSPVDLAETNIRNASEMVDNIRQ